MRMSAMLVTCAAVLVAASSAQAVTFGVKRVEVVNPINGTSWHLAEVEAFEVGSGINKAASANGGVAGADTATFGTVPGDANDGNTNGDFGSGSVWHGDATPGEKWFVDLAAPTDLDLVRIFGRDDCCQDRDNGLVLNLYDMNGALLFTTATGIPDIDFGGGGPNGNLVEIHDLTGGQLPLPEPVTGALLALGAVTLLRRRQRCVA